MNRLPKTDEMERAYLSSDTAYDGIFFLGVGTTGVFCRPSCGARKPLPRNVKYFASPREAIVAGYRPCKRCRPLEASGRSPDWVRSLLAEVDRDPSVRLRDADLRARGVDPSRARRYFRSHYGMTFQAYCRSRRLGEALGQLRGGAALDDVALGIGFESHSGFRDAFARTFGSPPGRSRKKDCVVTSWLESPLGPLIAAATEEGICLLEFSDRRMLETQLASLRQRLGRAVVPGGNAHLSVLKTQLDEYFEGKRTRFTVPLVNPGTPFQQRVWSELLRIPYGETRSYEDLAKAIGAPGAQRAVGTANGSNRIAIVIPCHRVVNKDGRLGGYGGGRWRKEHLLELERARGGMATLDFGAADRPAPLSSARSAGRPAG